MNTETEELVSSLATLCPFLSKDEWEGFLAASPEDQKLILTAFQSGQSPASHDALNTALQVLNGALAIASTVSGLAGAISAVETVVQLL